jgi:hypothetical protein
MTDLNVAVTPRLDQVVAALEILAKHAQACAAELRALEPQPPAVRYQAPAGAYRDGSGATQ